MVQGSIPKEIGRVRVYGEVDIFGQGVNYSVGGVRMNMGKKVFPGFTPVERYAEVGSCTWDPMLRKWQIRGQLILEYDEDNGEEYGFTLQDNFNGYDIVEEPNGPIPEPERHWLRQWAKTRQDQMRGQSDW